MYKEASRIVVTKVRLNVRKLLYCIGWDQGWCQEFPTRELTSATGKGLSQKDQSHVPFITSLFEGRKHVIYRKNNRNKWLETVYF